jgi:hypothetical protein
MVLRPWHVVKVHAISNCSNPTAALSPDERCEPALHCDIEPCSPSADAQHLESEIGRADDRRVVHPEVVADLADDHRPRLTTRG